MISPHYEACLAAIWRISFALFWFIPFLPLGWAVVFSSFQKKICYVISNGKVSFYHFAPIFCGLKRNRTWNHYPFLFIRLHFRNNYIKLKLYLVYESDIDLILKMNRYFRKSMPQNKCHNSTFRHFQMQKPNQIKLNM